MKKIKYYNSEIEALKLQSLTDLYIIVFNFTNRIRVKLL